MNIPCPIHAPCPDDANPIQNLSSEAPDVIHFFAYGSGPGSILPGNPSGPGSPGPDPGGNWDPNCQSGNGPATCIADSPEEARLCVDRGSQTCVPNPGDPPPANPQTPSDKPLFGNTLQSCNALCPDGSPFLFQVAAGLFVSRSQTLANQQARSYACRQAELLKMCFGSFSPAFACLGVAYTGSVTIVTGATVTSVTLFSGTIPTGLTLSVSGNVVTLSGTPTTPGNFSFTLKASDDAGHSMAKFFTIPVIGIVTASPLPQYVNNAAYSQTLTTVGGTAPYTYALISGVLPIGLSLSPTGTISGTPTVTGSSSFTIQVTDSASQTCSKAFVLSGGKAGFKVCDLANWESFLGGAFIGGTPLSGAPAWDGIFDLLTVDSGGNPMRYFVGQSLLGFSVAADENPLYPAGAWQDSQCFTFLQFQAPNVWIFTVADTQCLNTNTWFLIKADSVDPSGDYTNASAPGPDQVSIRSTSATCCPLAGNVVPVNFNPASPAQVRIKNFNAALFASCAGCTVGTTNEWDGTFPNKCTTGPANLRYLEGGGDCVNGTVYPPRSLNGYVIHTGIAGDQAFRISLIFVSGIAWRIRIICLPTGGGVEMWDGEKTTGDTPIGIYSRINGIFGSGCSTGPDCVEIEAY